MAVPRVSVVIPMKNEAAHIGRCLEGVLGQECEAPPEIIVIDSGSTDASLEIARRHPVRLIEIPADDFDHGLTRRMGAEEAEGEFIVFLVADAVPADKRWLANLIQPLLDDPQVAGSYSRQRIRPEIDPISAHHQKRWVVYDKQSKTFGLDPELPTSHEGSFGWFLSLEPSERHRLANFDDVSSCIRRTALAYFPDQPTPWAEDLEFSLRALTAGQRIVFAADSEVYHSHPTTPTYMFKRRWIDAQVIQRHFGYASVPDLRSVLGSFWTLLKEHGRAIADSPHSTAEKIHWRLANPEVSMAMALGSWLGGYTPDSRGIAVRFLKSIRKARVVDGEADRVSATVFTLEGQRRAVLMTHPNVKVEWSVRLPKGARLQANLGVKSEAHEKVAPIGFRATVASDGEEREVFEATLDPRNVPEDRGWRAVDVDLSSWGGRCIRLSLSAHADPSDYGWAGWADPVVSSDEKGFRQRFYDWLYARLTGRLGRKALRHA